MNFDLIICILGKCTRQEKKTHTFYPQKLLKIVENDYLLVMVRICKKSFSTSLTSFIVIQQTLNFLAPFAMALVYLRHCKINTEKKFKIKLCRCKCGRMVSFSFLRKLWFCWADSPHRAVSKIEWFKERIQHHSKRRQKSGTQYQIYNWWIGHRTWFLGSLRHNIRWANYKFLEQLHHDYIYIKPFVCVRVDPLIVHSYQEKRITWDLVFHLEHCLSFRDYTIAEWGKTQAV